MTDEPLTATTTAPAERPVTRVNTRVKAAAQRRRSRVNAATARYQRRIKPEIDRDI